LSQSGDRSVAAGGKGNDYLGLPQRVTQQFFCETCLLILAAGVAVVLGLLLCGGYNDQKTDTHLGGVGM